jgi:hypothetical protein
VAKRLFFAIAFSALVLVGQDMPRRPRWTLRTKTGTKIFVLGSAGETYFNDAFLALLETLKSLIVVRDDANHFLGDEQKSSFEAQSIVRMHREIDALCRRNDYACDDHVPQKGDLTATMAIRIDAIRAINFVVNTNQVYVGHPESEIVDIHRRILMICGADCPACRNR